MTDDRSAEIGSVLGNVHTGDGDIYATQVNVVLRKKPKQSTVQLAVDDLRRQNTRFVPPPNFQHALRILENDRTVLLHGAPGTGRDTAAKILLFRLPQGARPFRALPGEEHEEGRGGSRFSPDLILDDDRLWLNLSGADDKEWEEFQNAFGDLRAAVLARNAFLVVVLPDDHGKQLRGEYYHQRVEIGRPPGIEVMRSCLLADGVPGAENAPEPPRLSEYLHTKWSIEKVIIFSEMVIRARSNAKYEGDFHAWYAVAARALIDQRKQVERDLGKHYTGGRRRGLLLATAMLHGAHIEDVHHAAKLLFQAMNQSEDETPPLERADLVTMFREIGVECDENRRVRFRNDGYDSAVRDYFWQRLPEIHGRIRSWVNEMVTGDHFHQRTLTAEIAARYAELCLDDRYRRLLSSSVLTWMKNGSGSASWAADAALRAALRSERHGGFFRQAILNWSKSSETSARLANVIILMCTEVIAVHHPDQALVRLHHLARRAHGAVRARDALRWLIRNDPRTHRLMLARVTRLVEHEDIDTDLFLDLALSPEAFTDGTDRVRPLIAEAEVQEMLRDGWMDVFDRREPAIWRYHLEQWIRLAFHDERHRGAIVAVLAESAKKRFDVVGEMYAAACALPVESDEDRWRHRSFLQFLTDGVYSVFDHPIGAA